MIVKTLEDDWMRKSPGIAAVLSFFMPGAGLVYCERYLTGIVFFLLYSYMWYEVLFKNALWCVLWGLIIWAISIFASAGEANKYNETFKQKRDSLDI